MGDREHCDLAYYVNYNVICIMYYVLVAWWYVLISVGSRGTRVWDGESHDPCFGSLCVLYCLLTDCITALTVSVLQTGQPWQSGPRSQRT